MKESFQFIKSLSSVLNHLQHIGVCMSTCFCSLRRKENHISESITLQLTNHPVAGLHYIQMGNYESTFSFLPGPAHLTGCDWQHLCRASFSWFQTVSSVFPSGTRHGFVCFFLCLVRPGFMLKFDWLSICIFNAPASHCWLSTLQFALG